MQPFLWFEINVTLRNRKRATWVCLFSRQVAEIRITILQRSTDRFSWNLVQTLHITLLNTFNSLKMAAFWYITSCCLVEVDLRLRCAYCHHHQGTHRPNDGGSKHLWNVGKLLLDYTEQEPRRLSSSYSPPWEPEIWVLIPCYQQHTDKPAVKTCEVIK
jgi:hypothetical protein